MARPNPTATAERSSRELAVRDEIIALAHELAGDNFHSFAERIHFDGTVQWRVELRRCPPYPALIEIQGKLGDHLDRRLPNITPPHYVSVHGPGEL